MIRNIIFDWSGVIKDCVNSQLWVINKMFSEFGVSDISLEEFKKKWRQPYMKFYNEFIPELTLEEEQIVYKKVISKSPKSSYYPGIVNLIKDLKSKGVRMVVISSDFSENLKEEINNFNLNNIFIDVISDSHDKTDDVINVINKYKFDKEDTIIIGDSNHEVEAGKKAGIKTLSVTWGFTDRDKLSISNPDFIVNSIEELKTVLH
ncbi:MAG: HAD family hydrolase [Patescibacteria group bacterium]|nr:HAD family hydrolase [Candidatus Falkowbacteria bacterium]